MFKKVHITSKCFQNVKYILFVLSIENPCPIACYFVYYYRVKHIYIEFNLKRKGQRKYILSYIRVLLTAI